MYDAFLCFGGWACVALQKGIIFWLVAALLLIPVATMLGMTLSISINPEIAAGHPNYVRNFRPLEAAKNIVFLATVFIDCGLWIGCCFFMLKAKARSYCWLPLAMLGPFGLAALIVLEDRTPGSSDSYPRFKGWMTWLVRVVFEIVVFVAILNIAYLATALWRDLMIKAESWNTGVPVDTIIDRQNASAGMWAFSEGLEALFLVALFYILRPIFFSAVAFVRGSIMPSQRL